MSVNRFPFMRVLENLALRKWLTCVALARVNKLIPHGRSLFAACLLMVVGRLFCTVNQYCINICHGIIDLSLVIIEVKVSPHHLVIKHHGRILRCLSAFLGNMPFRCLRSRMLLFVKPRFPLSFRLLLDLSDRFLFGQLALLARFVAVDQLYVLRQWLFIDIRELLLRIVLLQLWLPLSQLTWWLFWMHGVSWRGNFSFHISSLAHIT